MIDKEQLKEDTKVLLGGIQDSIQDRVLDILIRNVEKHLLGLLRKVNKEIRVVPDELDYVIQEIVIRRFNRLGSEGMQSESVEGHSVTYYGLEEEFVPYSEIIEEYRKVDDGRGKVFFI